MCTGHQSRPQPPRAQDHYDYSCDYPCHLPKAGPPRTTSVWHFHPWQQQPSEPQQEHYILKYNTCKKHKVRSDTVKPSTHSDTSGRSDLVRSAGEHSPSEMSCHSGDATPPLGTAAATTGDVSGTLRLYQDGCQLYTISVHKKTVCTLLAQPPQSPSPSQF